MKIFEFNYVPNDLLSLGIFIDKDGPNATIYLPFIRFYIGYFDHIVTREQKRLENRKFIKKIRDELSKPKKKNKSYKELCKDELAEEFDNNCIKKISTKGKRND